MQHSSFSNNDDNYYFILSARDAPQQIFLLSPCAVLLNMAPMSTRVHGTS